VDDLQDVDERAEPGADLSRANDVPTDGEPDLVAGVVEAADLEAPAPADADNAMQRVTGGTNIEREAGGGWHLGSLRMPCLSSLPSPAVRVGLAGRAPGTSWQ